MGLLNKKKPKKLSKREVVKPETPSKVDEGSVESIFEDDKSEIINLSPKEAFLKFDTDSSGDIDSDEFYYLLECIGIKGKEEFQERLFKKYARGSRTIDYEGFKSAWMLLGAPKKELTDRGVKNLPKFATKLQLINLLEKTLADEERLEALAKAERERYRRLRDRRQLRTEYIEKAKARAGLELAAALDAAGQVYVLGVGAHGQFSAPAKNDMSTTTFHQDGFELVQSLWKERVANMYANSNTAGVWGRSSSKVVMTDNTILALTSSGLVSWGGTSNWLSTIQSSETTTPSRPLTAMQTTPRSSSLLMNDEHTHQKHLNSIQEEINEKDAKVIAEIEEMELVLQYYGQWPSHFDEIDDVVMIRDHLATNIPLDQLLHSLLLRGKPCEGNGLSKLEMAGMLAKDVLLERELLGEVGQLELRDIEQEILDLTKRKSVKAANYHRLKFTEKWAPLGRKQKQRAIDAETEKRAKTRSNRNNQNEAHEMWRAKQLQMEKSSVLENRGLKPGSITIRGGDLQTPRGVSQILDISAGANHAAMIVDDKRARGLYTWGLSSLGRLGQGNSVDCNYPGVVCRTPISNMSMGQSHSAAISSNGTLYLWGAGSSQLGFGEMKMPEGQGYYCCLPTKSSLSSKVVKVSCGAAHTACIGISGELYIWGVGDGGRLGLGRDRMATQHTPIVVESLRHENIFDVSCGTSTTLVLTATERTGSNNRTSVKKISGGRLYVAGPKNVVGESHPEFRQIECLKQQQLVIKSIGAGYSHQAFVSESGELYSWGHNLHGCCGQDKSTRFIPKPTKVDWLYEAPNNLALRKQCRLSSLYRDSAGLSSSKAVDGKIDGHEMSNLAHTQFEANPFCEIDLGSFAQITSIRLWNRTDSPDDAALHIDMFTRRLFPCVIMISQFPFASDLEDEPSIDKCLKQSVATVRLTKDQRCSIWNVPKFTTGRYVRIQLEDTNFLHFAQIEVFGHENCETPMNHRSIDSCSAGKFVTTALVRAKDPKGIETAYKRAVNADWYNSEILRNFDTYSNEHRKETNKFNCNAKCLLCVGGEVCEICSLKAAFRGELEVILNSNEPYRLEDLEATLLSASNLDRPESAKASDAVEDRFEGVAASGNKSRNILPVLMKMKQRGSLVRQKRMS